MTYLTPQPREVKKYIQGHTANARQIEVSISTTAVKRQQPLFAIRSAAKVVVNIKKEN